VNVIRAEGIRRSYGAFEALRGVSFEVEAGEIVGLLGPNGAGKTTCMKVLAGSLAPTGGRVTVCGRDVLSDPIGVQRQLGYLPEGAPVYDEMAVEPYLAFVASARGLEPASRARAIERVVGQCGLQERVKQRISTLSRGYRQRVGLAQALLHEPKVLILDEPTTGLDPNQIVEIRSLIREVGRTRTVILSTHVLSEVQVTCDRVLIIHEGRLVADDRTERLLGASSGQVLTIGLGQGKVEVDPDTLIGQLASVPGVTRVVAAPAGDERNRFTVYAGSDVRDAVFQWAVARGHVLVELSAERRDLEDVFRRLTVDGEAS